MAMKPLNPPLAIQCGAVEITATEAGRTKDGIAATLQAQIDGVPIVLRQVMLMKPGDRQQFAKEVAPATGRDFTEVDKALMHLASEIDMTLKAMAARTSLNSEAFVVSDDGVFFQETDDRPVKICARLDVIAYTRNTEGGDWGRLLRFQDADGRVKEWAMPMALLAGEGAVYRERLLSMGLCLEPGLKERNCLATYLQTMKVDARMTCTAKTGWHGEHFVMPDQTYGATEDEAIVYQSVTGAAHAMEISGNLDDWIAHVASFCQGNSRLAFAVSLAFAAPLIELTGEDSGGFHIRGLSSTGKTSALIVAGSVWGGGKQGNIHRWRATSNGLEAIATAHNDALLCLDELSQVDPREAGEIAYQLANGSGKQRANRSGGSRPSAHWRLLFLSTGEISLADHMATGGKRQRAGQAVRMVDIPADAGAGLGLFQNLHGAASGDAFARLLQENAKKYFGTPIRAFLTRLTIERASDRQELLATIKTQRDIFDLVCAPDNPSGEVSRVMGRFSLAAAAGELAIEYGILPWQCGEALTAAADCFQAWLAGRSSTHSTDTDALIAQIRVFIEQHGASRFASLEAPNDERIINRAGYTQLENGAVSEYLFLPEVFKQEVCKGYDARLALSELQRRGLLRPGNDGKPAASIRPRGLGVAKAYRIAASILA